MKVKCLGTHMFLEFQWNGPKSEGMDYEFDVAVEGCYYPGRPAKISGPPESCYPEDPDSFELYSLECSDGLPHDELELDEEFWDKLMDEAREEYAAMRADWEAEQAADREYWREYDTGR